MTCSRRVMECSDTKESREVSVDSRREFVCVCVCVCVRACVSVCVYDRKRTDGLKLWTIIVLNNIERRDAS